MRFSDLEDEPFEFGRFDHVLLGRIGRIGSFVMLAMLTQFIVGAADALMVGSMDDVVAATAGQAALGLGTPLYWMVGGFFSAVSYGKLRAMLNRVIAMEAIRCRCVRPSPSKKALKLKMRTVPPSPNARISA